MDWLKDWWEVITGITLGVGGVIVAIVRAVRRWLRGHEALHEALAELGRKRDIRLDKIEAALDYGSERFDRNDSDHKEIIEGQERIETMARETQTDLGQLLVHLKVKKPCEHD